VTYRARLELLVLRQMTGLPDTAFDTLVRALARICENPYDRLFSMPARDDPRERMAELSDSGFIMFVIDDAEGLIRVYDMIWVG